MHRLAKQIKENFEATVLAKGRDCCNTKLAALVEEEADKALSTLLELEHGKQKIASLEESLNEVK